MPARIPLFAFVIATLAFAAAPARAGDEAARLQHVLDDLAVMEALLSGPLSEPTRRELVLKLEGVRAGVISVQQDLLRGHAPGTTTGVHIDGPAGPLVSVTVQEDPGLQPPEMHVVGVVTEGGIEGPFAMERPGFRNLLAAVAAEPFDDGKLTVLREAARHNLFVVDQVLQLVPLFTFSDGKVDAAALLHDRVIDPENFYQVYGVFDFDSDKDELRRRIGR